MKIVITGACAEGKTTVAKLIADALGAAGIAAENLDEDVYFKSDYSEFQAKRLNTLADRKISITIETVQVRR